jgi:hypothetical protein
LGLEVGSGGGECGGLAGTSRTDDQLQLSTVRDGGDRGRLRRAEIVHVARDPRPRKVWLVHSATLGPCDQSFLFVEDGSGGERPVHGRFADRSAVATKRSAYRDGSGDVHTAGPSRMVGESV